MKIKPILFTVISFLCFFQSRSQTTTSDSTKSALLNEIIVSGYQNNRPLMEIPASIGVVQSADLQWFANTSLVPAVNTLPGVCMEERSPGSYRLSVRGSLVRSPFGIRNVKTYWNDITFTESYWSRLKAELIEGGAFLCLDNARLEVGEYIDNYYNTIRRHSALGYLSPIQFEALNKG